jgi:hypothetical protein
MNEGLTVPNGMLVSKGFFASDKPWPLFFAPSEVKRIGVFACPSDLTFIEMTKAYPCSGTITFIFEQHDEAKLKNGEYSIYSFDIKQFRRIPSGEYLAEVPVYPIQETVYENSLSAIIGSGINVVFVDDIEPTYEILKQNRVDFYALRHVIGAIRDAEKIQQIHNSA